MTVALTQTRVRPDDSSYDVIAVIVGYPGARVTVRVQFGSGDVQDLIYDGVRLTNLRNAVSQFAGLRLALEQYIAANEPGLGGNAS